MTPAQVAERYGITVTNLAQRRVYRIGPPFRGFGRRILYKKKDIEEYIEKGRVRTRR
ncbi:MAG: helix-turn-helix domain-containing protein [Deltaproteobacteria bacterium]|nr:helix-turn-helix domain-containing protein [Deltaproteobacteria bacterium]